LYERRVADAPVAGQPVLIRLHVRKFVCGTLDCAPRVTTLPIDLLRHEILRSLSPADEHAITEIVDQVFLPLVSR
jgi:hypothetical protein